MKFLPIVEIVQIDGVLAGAGVVRQAVRGENPLARGIIVIVAPDRGVQGVDRSLVQFDSGLFLNPRLELDRKSVV